MGDHGGEEHKQPSLKRVRRVVFPGMKVAHADFRHAAPFVSDADPILSSGLTHNVPDARQNVVVQLALKRKVTLNQLLRSKMAKLRAAAAMSIRVAIENVSRVRDAYNR
jgi:hypothetical protein